MSPARRSRPLRNTRSKLNRLGLPNGLSEGGRGLVWVNNENRRCKGCGKVHPIMSFRCVPIEFSLYINLQDKEMIPTPENVRETVDWRFTQKKNLVVPGATPIF